MNIQELQLGRNGMYTVASTSAVDLTAQLNGKFVVCVVNADAVFTALTDDSDDSVITYSNMSGVTYAAGTIISPRYQKYFKSVTLASGSVIFYAL